MLTDEQWAILEPLFNEERNGAGRPQIHSDREVLNACFGFCALAQPGKICLIDFPLHPLAIDDSVSGLRMDDYGKCWRHWPGILKIRA